MRTCYLHLGMPKTGSTTIQQSFFGYEGENLAYAKMPQGNHQRPLNLVFSNHPENLPFSRQTELSAERVKKDKQRAKKQLLKAATGRKNTIFSGEMMMDQLRPNEIDEMFAFFKSHFDRVVPIIYVRPLAALTASQFQQRVKSGLGSFKLPQPRYRRRFAPICNNKDRDDIIFVRFDRASLIGGNVITDFAARVGAASVPEQAATSNESLSAEAVGALYGFNKYTSWQLRPRARKTMLKQMYEALQGQGERKFGFAPELIEQHLADQAEDIKWVEDTTGFDVKGTISTVP